MKRSFILLIAIALTLVVSPPVRAQDAGALKLPPYKKVKLTNGMTLLLMEQHEVPMISFSFIVKSGSTADPMGKEGAASFAAGMLR